MQFAVAEHAIFCHSCAPALPNTLKETAVLAPATCLPCHWDISPEIAARLSERAGRQRAMTADDQILLVLFHAPQPRQRERHPAYFLRGSDGAWQTPDREDGLETLRQLIDEYDQQLARLEEEQDSASSIAEWFKILSEVGPLFRATRNMYDALQSARQSISDPLRRQELQRPCDRASDAMRAAELLQMDAHNSVQFSLAQQAEIQAELSQQQTTASHRLTYWLPSFYHSPPSRASLA